MEPARCSSQTSKEDSLPTQIERLRAYRKAIELVHRRMLDVSQARRKQSLTQIDSVLQSRNDGAVHKPVENLKWIESKSRSPQYTTNKKRSSGHGFQSASKTSIESSQQNTRGSLLSRRNTSCQANSDQNAEAEPVAQERPQHYAPRKEQQNPQSPATNIKDCGRNKPPQAESRPQGSSAVPPIQTTASVSGVPTQPTASSTNTSAAVPKLSYVSKTHDPKRTLLASSYTSRYTQPSPRSVSSEERDESDYLTDLKKKTLSPVSPFRFPESSSMNNHTSSEQQHTARMRKTRKPSIQAMVYLSPLDANVYNNVFEVDLSNCNLHEWAQ
eukprot:gb/GECG01007791.1/.p1 GENE.gb/GECG01007791.1/~~gb/GECG01007791.1/.p1  ORF type:complete len:328 (+),score=32.87 gb/GECG01007791.1/:1-984(+)